MENNRTKGRRYEEKAADYLTAEGCEILARNERLSRYEIDLIAREGDVIVFVEVKYRADGDCGSGLEAVDARKRSRIRAAAKEYLYRHRNLYGMPSRFDVISFAGDQMIHIREAF